MLEDIINDLKENYSQENLHVLARYYKINENVDEENLLKKIAEKIAEINEQISWNVYCKTNYIPNVIDNTRKQLLKDLQKRSICDLTKDLTRIGKSSTSAAVFDYHPTQTTRAVIKVSPDKKSIQKEIELSQLLSGGSHYPFIYCIQKCDKKYYIVMERLGPTLSDLLSENVSIKTIKKIIRDVLDAIDNMLALGIVHTDLNPDNIMLRCTGKTTYQTVVIDFDLVNNPERGIENYNLFDVYDFMRRLHDEPIFEKHYPKLHAIATKIYLGLENGDKNLSKIKSAKNFKKMFD